MAENTQSIKKDFQGELAKYLAEKDFVYGPEPEIYSPIAGFYSYGLNGKCLKNKIEAEIRKVFTKNGFYEMEFPLIVPEAVWEASGHLKGFNDPIVICSKCKSSFRADKLIEEAVGIAADHFDNGKLVDTIKEHDINCPNCKGRFNLDVQRQSLMMKTIIGKDTVAYNRPETATTTYLPFKHYVNFFRGKLPFTVFQIGKAFRNEISPRQHLIRQREFTQAESQMFISKDLKKTFPPFQKIKNIEMPLWTESMQKENKKWNLITVEDAMNKKYLKNQAYAWNLWLSYEILLSAGIPKEKIRFRQHHSDERAFYSDDTWDLEVELNSFGWVEMVGISDRTDYDLTQHAKHSKTELVVRNEDGTTFVPDVIEVAFGVDRPFYALLDIAFSRRETDAQRTVLSIPARLAPIEIGVFPLLKKDNLPEKAEEVINALNGFKTYYDEAGSIGKRYSRLDAIGTPFCITIDHDTLKDNTVTVRERDSLKQERIAIKDLKEYFKKAFDKE